MSMSPSRPRLRPRCRSGGVSLFIPTGLPLPRAVAAIGAVGMRRATCTATPPPPRPPPARKGDGVDGGEEVVGDVRSVRPSKPRGTNGDMGRPAPFGSEIGPTTGARRRRRGQGGSEGGVGDGGGGGGGEEDVQNDVQNVVDIDSLPSVPLVRKDVSPESGEDYWMELGSATQAQMRESNRGTTDIDDGLKQRLKNEVVSPYTQNWILRVAIVVALLAVLVAIFGGADNVPIISVPDL